MHKESRQTARKRRPTGRPSVARLAAVPRAYVGLGSNLGDRESTIRSALSELGAAPGVEVVAVSTLVDTEPVGYLDQPRFLNAVAALETGLSPRDLLDLLLALEARFGRDRAVVPAQGPRTLDLDLLLYGDAEIDEPGLRVPHPRLHERGFVLGPLAELAPCLEVPGKGSIQTLLAGLD
jgi:2-amino-4-hydroxy-6-hydroxymethyldihydropteridine diphosphokinase